MGGRGLSGQTQRWEEGGDEKRRDRGVAALSSHSVTLGLAVFTELSVTW